MAHNPELFKNSLVQDEFYKLSKSIMVGFGNGLASTCHAIAHPLDSVVYPISSFVYDAAVISSKNAQPIPEFDILHSIVSASPHLYDESIHRMNSRMEEAKIGINDFKAASLNRKFEIVSQGATEFFVPGGFIKSIKHLSNFHKYGTSQPPAKFWNTIGNDTPSTFPDIKLYTLDEIRNTIAHKFVYTFTDELLIASPAYDKVLTRGVHPSHWLSYSIKHPELAKLKPVFAAGELIVENGQIIAINNRSGHYIPRNVSPALVEKAFIDSGFVEATGKYQEIKVNPKRQRHPRVTQNKIPNSIRPIVDLDSTETESKEPVQNIVPCSQYFDMYEMTPEDIKDLTQKFEQSYREYKVDMSNRVAMIEWSNSLSQIATLGSGLSNLALLTGGHRRTWKNVGTVCSGLSTLASGLSSIAMGKGMLSIAGGYLGVAIGCVSMFMGLFGDDDDNGLEEAFQQLSQQLTEMLNTIMGALQTIHQTIIDGFHHIENLILGSVIPRLIEINSKLDRLENITTSSFKELHGKSLIDLIDIIKKDILGESKLTGPEQKKYIRKLGTWIDCHSKSPLQTSLLRVGDDDRKSAEILSTITDPYDIFPFFVFELTRLTGISLDFNGIPNIPTFIVALDTYLSCVLKYHDNTEVLIRAKDTISRIETLIQTISEGSCEDILRRQYDHYRFLVGRQISLCRTDYTDATTPLIKYLKVGPEYEKLQNLLDSLELRRVMISHLEHICQKPHSKLQSKADILSTVNCTFITKSFQYAKTADYENFKQALNLGLSVNTFDSWGQPLHYLTRFGGAPPKMIHLLFQCPNIEINQYMKYDLGDTYGPGIRPILYVMNCGIFQTGILFCAQGHDINEYNIPYGFLVDGSFGRTDMGNIYRASDGTWGKGFNCQLTVSLTKAMNNPKSKINKTDLRKAYNYYKTVSNGFPSKETINGDCLMLLTCILGDLYPFKYSKLIVNVNDPLESYGLTYLMLASYCKQPEVVHYLLTLGANVNALTTLSSQIPILDDNHEDLVIKAINPVFDHIINRIEGTLSVPRPKNHYTEQCTMLIDLLQTDIEYCDTKLVEHYFTLIRNEESGPIIGNYFDTLDSIYRLANKKHNFGYNLSSKIERFIQSII